MTLFNANYDATIRNNRYCEITILIIYYDVCITVGRVGFRYTLNHFISSFRMWLLNVEDVLTNRGMPV